MLAKRSVKRLSDGHSDRERAPLLFLAGAASAVVYHLFRPPGAIEGGGEMIALASNLAAEGVFGNPFTTFSTGPTAALAPLYPAFLAVLMLIGGSWAPIIAVIVAIVLSGLHASLLPYISRVLSGNVAPGYWAALLSVFFPLLPLAPAWEAGAAAVAAMAVVSWTASLLEKGSISPGRILGVGSAHGLLALLNPAVSLVGFIFVAWVLFRRKLPALRLVVSTASVCLIALLTCLPWMVRNHLRVGSFSLKNNFGMTFYASHNDCASPSLVDSILSGCYDKHHPAGSQAEAELMYRLGEERYNQMRKLAASEWIHRNPGAFARLTFGRILDFWFPTPRWHVYAYATWAATALALPGLCLVLKRRVPGALFLMLVLLLYPLPYYLVVSDIRYRLPVLWVSLLLAGHCLAAAGARIAPSPPRGGADMMCNSS